MIAMPAWLIFTTIKFIFMYVNSMNGKSLTLILFGVSFFLSSCKKDPFAIFKEGNSNAGKPIVLVAGYESNGTNYVAKYWIDGQEIKLSDGTGNGGANSILVSDDDLYIAGSDSGAKK